MVTTKLEEITFKPNPSTKQSNSEFSDNKYIFSETQLASSERRENLERKTADRLLRDKYSFKAYKIVKKSLWGWATLLTIYALIKFLTKNETNGHGFEIFSDTVLIAITSATTLNIFAAFLSLVKGLFPSQDTTD